MWFFREAKSELFGMKRARNSNLTAIVHVTTNGFVGDCVEAVSKLKLLTVFGKVLAINVWASDGDLGGFSEKRNWSLVNMHTYAY
jgi:hypothetical protein